MPNVVNADAEAGPLGEPAKATLDLPFLATQTFGDTDLVREVLILFVEQARRVVASLPALAPAEQGDAAHLLKGSARGIGAWAAAAIAEAYEVADLEGREAIHPDLAATFADAEAAIGDYLGSLQAA